MAAATFGRATGVAEMEVGVAPWWGDLSSDQVIQMMFWKKAKNLN